MSERLKMGDQSIEAVNLTEGRYLLADLVRGKVRPSEIPVVYATKVNRRNNKSGSYITLPNPLGNVNFGPEVTSVFDQEGALAFIPKEEQRYGYRWVDIHGVNRGTSEVAEQVLESFRVNSERQKFENIGWYGPQLQPFLEVLSQVRSVEESLPLPPFVITYKESGLYLGRYEGKNYHINAQGFPIYSGTAIRLEPQFDPERKYFWVDGFKDGDESGGLLFTRRIQIGGKTLITEWKGDTVQSTADWIYGVHDISKAQEVKHDFSKNGATAIHLGNNLVTYFNNTQLDKTQPAFLVPKEKGPYKWLEIQQEDQDGRKTFSKVFVDKSSGKVVLKGGWRGPEIQAIADFIEGKHDQNNLEAFNSTIKGGQVHLLKYGNKDLALRFNTVVPDMDVTVVPSVSAEGDLVIDVEGMASGTPVSRAIFDRKTVSFRGISSDSFRTFRPNGYWTDERILAKAQEIVTKHGDITVALAVAEVNGGYVNSILTNYEGGFLKLRADLGFVQSDRTGHYTDKDGNVWASRLAIEQRVGRRLTNLQRLLKNSEVPFVEGRGVSGKQATLYSIEEAVAYLNQPNTKELVSKDDANKALDSLFEEVDL